MKRPHPVPAPRCERLEHRRLLSTYTVTTPADAGPGSLRQAILDANASPGPDDVAFAVGTGPVSIAPAAPLPDVTDPITLDGTTQPGYAGRPIVEITGSAAGGAATDGLVLLAPDCTLRGLVVNRWTGTGVVSKYNTGRGAFENNYVGTDLTGLAPAPNRIHGLLLMTDGNRVGGTLASQRNVISGNGVIGLFFLLSNSNTVRGNYVGVGRDGATPVGNTTGIDSQDGGGTLFLDNVVSGNTQDGLLLFTGADHCVVQGNRIGTDADGLAAVPNGGWGVEVQSAYNLIGGTTPAARNILSGNVASGIVFYLGSAHHNLVQGNFIGTDVTGTRPIPNVNQGVSFSGDTDVDLTAPGPHDNLIGGTTPAERNVISGNGTGVGIFNRSRYNTIAGNYVGTDVTGAHPVPNETGFNVFLDSDHNTIGGDAPGAGNVIAASLLDAINLGSDATTVQGNTFGLAADGTSPLPTGGHAILTIFSSHHRIGGTAPGAGNVFANSRDCAIKLAGGTDNRVEGNYIGTDVSGVTPAGNGSAGVWFDGSSLGRVADNLIANSPGFGVIVQSGAGNTISRNRVFANGSPGIDLGGDGVTPNTPGGPHAGPNDLQNYPVLVSAVGDGAGVTVTGALDSAPNAAYTIEFFTAPAPHASGHGDARAYLGAITVTTGGDGTATFAHTFAVPTDAGQVVTATATAADGSTSEFAADVAVVAAPAPAVTAAEFAWAAAPNALRFTFTQDVHASLGVDDLVVYDLASAASVLNPTAVTWDASTLTAIFALPSPLPDGDYRAILLAAGVTNANGAALAADAPVDFFAFAGDANHDRAVDFDDLVVLAQNYNTTGKLFAQGDFNADGDVDFDDLVVLAQRYNTTLPTPPAPARSFSRTPIAKRAFASRG